MVTLTAPRIHGAPTATLTLDPRSGEWEQFRERLGRQQTSEQFFKAAGAKLFEGIFPAQHRISYEINYQHAKEDIENRLLQVQMRVPDEEVIDLPWECMFNPVAKLWLAANPLTPFSRYVDAQAAAPLRLEPPLKLLIVTAEPRSLPPVGAEEEIEAVKNALGPLLRDRLVTAKLLARGTRRSLSRAIEDFRPHLFHFVGHGQRMGYTCGLVLETKDGSEELLGVDTLCELLQQSGQMRAAVLNACQTSGAALALAKAGIAAVGMQDKISSQAAIPFCRSFYEAVASAVPLDLAANRARFSIRLECGADRRDWCLPAIFLPAGRADLFEIERSARLIRVTSDPPGASIFLDGRPTDKATPETLVMKDGAEHDVHVALAGRGSSRPQRVAAEVGKPVQLDFHLAAAPGFLVVSVGRSGAHVMIQRYGSTRALRLGQVDKLRRVGPRRLEPGRYRVTASWPAAPGESPTTSEDEVVVVEGKTSHVQLPYPSPILYEPASLIGPAMRRRLPLIGGIVAAAVLLGAVLTLAIIRPWAVSTPVKEPPAARAPAQPALPPPPFEMVAIPAGNLFRGYRDETVTMRLIRKYELTSGSAIVELLTTPPRQVAMEPYYIDRREVTNGEYIKFLAAVQEAKGDAAWRHPSQPADKTDHTPLEQTWKNARFRQLDQPVVGIDWYDAYAYAKWAGKRLPADDEWELAARGTQRLAYPWGNTYEAGKCNAYEAPTNSPLPSGRFRGDRSPYGLLETGGNVSEWTATPGASDKQRIVRGGSWNRRPGDIFAVTFMRCYADLDVRNLRLGIRCAWTAEAGKPAPAGMVRIPGATVTLGGETSGLLEALRTMTRQLGDAQKYLVAIKPHTVPVSAFAIGKYEVTNAQYRKFLQAVKAGGDAKYRHPDQPSGKDHTPEYWDNTRFNGDAKPVVGVDWYDAYAYARWAGMRLPTANEWERAARGSTEYLYPWGNDLGTGKCNGLRVESTNSATQGGTFPNDRSPLGVMDMAGNVMEWTADDFPGGTSGEKLFKGGAWNLPCRVYALIYARLRGEPRTYRQRHLGFRCARDIRSK